MGKFILLPLLSLCVIGCSKQHDNQLYEYNTPDVSKSWVIALDGINLYSGPNINDQIICNIPFRESVDVLGEVGNQIVFDNAKSKLVFIKYGDNWGYVFGANLSETNSLSALLGNTFSATYFSISYPRIGWNIISKGNLLRLDRSNSIHIEIPSIAMGPSERPGAELSKGSFGRNNNIIVNCLTYYIPNKSIPSEVYYYTEDFKFTMSIVGSGKDWLDSLEIANEMIKTLELNAK
jgi:hypothetical protein